MADTEDEVTLTKRLVAETSANGQRQQKRRKKQSLRSERIPQNIYCARHGKASSCAICIVSSARHAQLNNSLTVSEEGSTSSNQTCVDQSLARRCETFPRRRVLTDVEDLLLLCSSALNRSGLQLGRNPCETLHARRSSATMYRMYLTLASALLTTKDFKRFGEAQSHSSLRRYVSKLRLKYSLGSPDVLFDTIILSSVSAYPFNELQGSASTVLNYILKMSAVRALWTGGIPVPISKAISHIVNSKSVGHHEQTHNSKGSKDELN